MKPLDRRHAPPLERGGSVLLAGVVLTVLIFDVLPLARLAWAALAPGGVFAPARAFETVTGRGSLAATWNSLETASLSALLALALGAAMTVLLGVMDLRGRRLAALAFVLSTLVSPQVVALAFLGLAGPGSPLLATLGLSPAPGSPNPLVGRNGIVFVLGLHHAPLAFVVLTAGLRRIPASLVEAARVDGATPVGILWTLVLPLLRPHLVAAGLLAFVAGIGNFGIPALLGFPANYLTLPTLIYRRLSSFGPSVIADVAALGVMVAALAIVCVAASRLVLQRQAVRFEAEERLEPFWRLGGGRPVAAAAVLLVLGVCVALPLVSLLTASLVPSYGMPLTAATATLDNYVEVLLRQAVTARAFANSFLYAGGSALALALAAMPLAYALERRAGRWRSLAEALVEVPYVMPGIVLAVACILIFLRPLPLLGVSLYATPWIIVFAYLARFLPVVLKPVLAAMRQIDVAQEEAAALDGAGPLRRLLRIVVPGLLPAAAAGGLLAFLLAFSELTVSALLWTAGTETLGVVLFGLEEAGFVSHAAAVAVVSIAVIAGTMAVLDALAARLPAGALPWR